MNASHAVILVDSTSHALRIEKLFQASGLACKLIPVPRHLSSDCGVCIRIKSEIVDAVRPDVEKIDGFTGIVRI